MMASVVDTNSSESNSTNTSIAVCYNSAAESATVAAEAAVAAETNAKQTLVALKASADVSADEIRAATAAVDAAIATLAAAEKQVAAARKWVNVPPFPSFGYFAAPDKHPAGQNWSYQFLDCGGEECVGGPEFACEQGYHGELCGNCAEGFWQVVSYCVVCEEGLGASFWVFVLTAAGLFTAWFFLNEFAAMGTVRVFRQKCTLEDAIGSHACSPDANMRMTNGIPLGRPLLLLVCTVICVQTLKAMRSLTSR
jgi:hypothetical protein